MYRMGFGYDIHRLEAGRKLFLGGIEIPHTEGLVGHSDGDALIHAVIDALLGALGERDIGQLFPDTDPRYKDIRSTELLREVMNLLKKRKGKILNVDSVIVAERPRLASYTEKMKEALSLLLGIDKSRIGIKAKTNEGLGSTGGGKAIACWAVILGDIP